MSRRKLAIVTGASTGIGLEIARIAAQDGYDLIVAADEPLADAAARQKNLGVDVQSVEADLATDQGVKQLLLAAGDRQIDVLVANAGQGHGGAFVDQNPEDWKHTIGTNVTGTLQLIQPVLRQMLERDEGHPGDWLDRRIHSGILQRGLQRHQAFIDNFCAAISDEIKDSRVTITVLKPGATDTEFFRRADMLDTKVGQMDKDDPADAAKTGWDAMLKGERGVVHGLMNKATVLAAGLAPESLTARKHRAQAEPGSADE